MLPITLEPQTQTNLFQTRERSVSHFELQVVNEGLFPEVRLYYLANKKKKRSGKQKRKSSQKKNQAISLRLTA
jgi:hypothetical protein